jgi:hypothetical protein
MFSRVATVLAAVAVFLAMKLSRPLGRLRGWVPRLHAGQFEVRDLVSLVVAGLALYLSWQAIEMGKRQENIANRQAEIAERQFQIQQGQLAQEAPLSIMPTGTFHPKQPISLAILNEGFAEVTVQMVTLFVMSDSDNVRCVDMDGHAAQHSSSDGNDLFDRPIKGVHVYSPKLIKVPPRGHAIAMRCAVALKPGAPNATDFIGTLIHLRWDVANADAKVFSGTSFLYRQASVDIF